MAAHATPHFHNEDGHRVITIGAKEFMCIGAMAPFDPRTSSSTWATRPRRSVPIAQPSIATAPDLHADETDRRDACSSSPPEPGCRI